MRKYTHRQQKYNNIAMNSVEIPFRIHRHLNIWAIFIEPPTKELSHQLKASSKKISMSSLIAIACCSFDSFFFILTFPNSNYRLEKMAKWLDLRNLYFICFFSSCVWCFCRSMSGTKYEQFECAVLAALITRKLTSGIGCNNRCVCVQGLHAFDGFSSSFFLRMNKELYIIMDLAKWKGMGKPNRFKIFLIIFATEIFVVPALRTFN